MNIMEIQVELNNKYPFMGEEAKEYYSASSGYIGFPVDVLIDNYFFFNMYGHAPWIYFRNGYGRKDYFIPMLIDEYPQIPIDYELKIFESDFEKIRKIVSYNRSRLFNIALNKDEELFPINQINESVYLNPINEMMTILKSKDTGLPKDIWIDNSGTNPKHSKYRIKIQNNQYKNNSHNWCTVVMDDFRTIGYNDWTPKEMAELRKFSEKNYDVIKTAIDNKWSTNKILNEIIPINNSPTTPIKKLPKDYIFSHNIENGYSVYRENTENKFYLFRGGKIVSDGYDGIGSFSNTPNKDACLCWNYINGWLVIYYYYNQNKVIRDYGNIRAK